MQSLLIRLLAALITFAINVAVVRLIGKEKKVERHQRPVVQVISPVEFPPSSDSILNFRPANWRNPEILVGTSRVTVVTSALPDGKKVSALDALKSDLQSLPKSAWPSGMVVLIYYDDTASTNIDKAVQNDHRSREILDSLGIDTIDVVGSVPPRLPFVPVPR